MRHSPIFTEPNFVLASVKFQGANSTIFVFQPYQRALLERGVVAPRSSQSAAEDPLLLAGMMYSGSVGMMVMDDMASVYEIVGGEQSSHEETMGSGFNDEVKCGGSSLGV